MLRNTDAACVAGLAELFLELASLRKRGQTRPERCYEIIHELRALERPYFGPNAT